MVEWNKNNLGELIISKNDKSKQLKSSEYLTLGLYPIIDQSEKFICGYSEEKSKVIFNDLPITVFGDHTRHTKFVDFPFICGADGTQLIKPKGDIDDKFFYYLILNSSNLIGNFGYDRHFKHLKEFEVKYPESKPEQTSIAEILSTADEAIAHTEALIAKYQRIKTGLMQDLLTKGIDKNGNIRSEATHQFKDSPLGRIPKEWDCDKLISFCQKIQDGTHFSPKTDANGTHKYITSKNIRMGYLDLSNLEFIDEVSHNKIYKRCSVEFGDVLLTKDGASTGNICLNNLNEEFSMLSSVALIRGKRGVLKNEFIFQFFMETNGQMSLVEQMSGNAITRITLTKINNTLIKVPSFPEQELIIQRLKSLDELVNDEKTKLSKLQSLKTGLMQDLLSGKVRVNLN